MNPKQHADAQRPWKGLEPNKVGDMHELKVCADLLAKGFEVFKNVARTGPYDVIAIKKDKIYKIDVKTGYFNKCGTLSYCKRFKAPFIAVVTADSIYYIPEVK